MLRRAKGFLFEAYTWIAVIAVGLFLAVLPIGVWRLLGVASNAFGLATLMGLLLSTGGICLAIYQLLIMRKQLDIAQAQGVIMRQQSEIMLRQAILQVFYQSDTTGIADCDFPGGRPQTVVSMSRRLFVVNTGTRGAHGFICTVRCNEPLQLVRSSDWTTRTGSQRSYFIYSADRSVYPGSLIDVPVLTVYKMNNSPGAMLNEAEAQISYDDGISAWVRPEPLEEFRYPENGSEKTRAGPR